MAGNRLVNFGLPVAAGIAFAFWQGGLWDEFRSLYLSGNGPARSTASASADDADWAKLNANVDCLNTVDSNLRQIYGQYRAAYDGLVQGATGMGPFHSFKIQPYEQDNQFSKDCIAGLATAIKAAPAMPVLDRAASDFSTALTELVPLMNETGTYYDQEDWKDDALAKGKALDAQIAPLFTRLFAAGDQMHVEVAKASKDLRARELAAMEAANGRDYDWQTQNLMNLSRDSIDAVDGMLATSTLTVEGLKPIEDTMQAAFDAAQAYAKANPDAKTALGNKPLWFDLESDFGDVLARLKDLRRALTDGGDANPALDGLFGDYNSLVKSYNMMAPLKA